MTRKALITGGAGFIGLHLARELREQGYEVILADNFSRGVKDAELDSIAADPGVTLMTVDLLDPATITALPDDLEHIYHFAAIIGVQHVLERPYAVLAENVQMLTNAIELARRQKDISRLVFASTSEVYAGTLHHFGLPSPTPESTPLTISPLEEARSAYMLSKIYGEALCRHSGLPVTLIRPHNFYGPRMGLSHVIPQLLERAHHAADGDVFDVYSVDHMRTFAFIDDAVQVIRRAAENEACEGEVINVGNQEPEVTIGDLAKLILDVVGRDLRVVPQPATPGSPHRRCPDISRATELTGYAPRISLESGIKRTYRWYADNVFTGAQISAR